MSTCNSNIRWDIKEQKFKCEYCKNTFTIDEIKKHSKKSDNKKSTIEDNLISYKCKSCGAEIIADENTIATFCVYCGNTAILKQKIDSVKAPDYIIPFKKTKNDAINAYNKLLEGKFLLPKEFSNKENIEKITGIYIPFWAYDITIDGEVDFRSEDTRKWTSGDYEYEETKIYHVTIDGHYEFNKILCDGSKYFQDDLMDSISPYKLEELKEYSYSYFSGFLADKYDVDNNEIYKRAKERSVNSAIACARTITGHFSDSYMDDRYKIDNKKSYYLFLPVWMMNVKYEDKIYTFAMNGQTGKMVGNLPINKLKFAFITIGLFILTIVFWLLIIFVIGEYL